MDKLFIGGAHCQLTSNDNEDILSLYIHIPFCDHICSYCDFKKMVGSDELKEKYINALLIDLSNQYKLNNLNNIKTIYIGGGTPSCLPLNLLDKLLSNLSKYIDLKSIIEFTIEANPKDINIDLVNLFNKYHVNRISLGAQSFDDTKLKLLRRNHNKNDIINAIKLLQENNIDNINVDLIYGFPLDNIDLIKSDLDYAINCKVNHISYYSLILEENTILYHQYENNKFMEMDGDTERDIYDFINSYLKKYNYNRYEVSNFSIKDCESLHNIITWKNLHYAGIGVSASYYIDGIRYTNINNIEKYIEILNSDDKYKFDDIIEERIALEDDDIMYEEIMLGLRLNIGLDKDKFFNRFNKNILDAFPNINDLIKDNILIDQDGFIKIKDDLMYIQNTIILKIFS